MFPVECYTADSPYKLEAIKYYIELNKAFLKEISVLKYDDFVDYLKGIGKQVIANISDAKSNEELLSCLNAIDKALPYSAKLKKYETIEEKVQYLHKEMAKLQVNGVTEPFNYKKSLRIQRELAKEYEELTDVLAKYKDALNNLHYMKSVSNGEIKLTAVSKDAIGNGNFAESFKSIAQEMIYETKLARSKAFEKSRNYYVKELVNILEHDEVLRTNEK